MDDDLLYQTIGKRIKKAREHTVQKISQAKLAQELRISRVSVVNIEAGRQRPPIHLLWNIAEVLGTEVALLIPRRSELEAVESRMTLSPEDVAAIEAQANLDPETRRQVSTWIGEVRGRTIPPEKSQPL